jgi:hypothetical protein
MPGIPIAGYGRNGRFGKCGDRRERRDKSAIQPCKTGNNRSAVHFHSEAYGLHGRKVTGPEQAYTNKKKIRTIAEDQNQ